MALTSEITHGTGVPITKEFAVDMRNIIYRLDPQTNPFLVFLNMFPKVTAYSYKYEWLEREGFARRTFTGKWIKTATAGEPTEIIMGLQLNARDWNAIAQISSDISLEADAKGLIRLVVTNKDAGVTADKTWVVGYIKRSAYENGHTRRKLYNVSGGASTDFYYNTIWLSKEASTQATLVNVANEAELIIAEDDYTAGTFTWDDALINDGDDAFVTVELPNMQAMGYKQGSGLGEETKKVSRHLYGYTQIFKTKSVVTGTLAACRLIGGDERTKRQFESGQAHASELEYALIFQGGGTEGVGGDWGILDSSENPKTRFKGLGVGHASGKEGYIISNNGNPLAPDPTPCTVTAGSPTSYLDFMERLYDDMKVGTPNKLGFCSLAWIKDLSKIALDSQKYFTLNLDAPMASALGVNIRRFVTPFGTLDLAHHPMFTGEYRRYCLILDMKNIAQRPLNGRDTQLQLDVGSKEVDGIVDQWLTETGLEVRHEHTHAIGYLSGSI